MPPLRDAAVVPCRDSAMPPLCDAAVVPCRNMRCRRCAMRPLCHAAILRCRDYAMPDLSDDAIVRYRDCRNCAMPGLSHARRLSGCRGAACLWQCLCETLCREMKFQNCSNKTGTEEDAKDGNTEQPGDSVALSKVPLAQLRPCLRSSPRHGYWRCSSGSAWRRTPHYSPLKFQNRSNKTGTEEDAEDGDAEQPGDSVALRPPPPRPPRFHGPGGGRGPHPRAVDGRRRGRPVHGGDQRGPGEHPRHSPTSGSEPGRASGSAASSSTAGPGPSPTPRLPMPRAARRRSRRRCGRWAYRRPRTPIRSRGQPSADAPARLCSAEHPAGSAPTCPGITGWHGTGAHAALWMSKARAAPTVSTVLP